MPIVKEKFTDIWKRREPLYLKEKKIYRGPMSRFSTG